MEKSLKRNLSFAVKKLSNVLSVLLRLLEEDLITQDEFDTVKHKPPNLEQNTELIFILMKKDDKILPVFLEILRNTGNKPVAQKLEETGNIQSKVINSDSGNEPEPSNGQRLSNKKSGKPSEKLLEEKWWPERKFLVNTFYERKLDDQLITEKLYSLLHENENKTTVITQDTLVVSGLGGIGKTCIAKSFAVQYEAEYNYIIWIDCGEGSLIRSFQSLARKLKVEDRSELELTELARECFLVLKEMKCLLIYDNAECYIGNEGIRDVLPKCEGNNNLHSIITSRNQEWGTETGYGKITKFWMNVFSTNDTVQFLRKALNKSTNVDDCNLSRLGDLLGHLPLALQLAVATLNNQQITVTEYIEQIAGDDNPDILFNEKFDDYERTINKTMKISLKQIRKDENGRNAYTILTTLGYLQPDGVEFNFLSDIISVKLGDVKHGIFVLEKYSLVTVEKKNTLSECVSIHRLLQQVIRHNGSIDEKDILKKILSCEGRIKYKLIPYTFAEKHVYLKKQFSRLRDQIIDEVKLTKLLSKRQFTEASNLAMIIHSTFKLDNSTAKYLLSKYNYAVCLEKSGQKNDSLKIFKSLYEELGNEEGTSYASIHELGSTWTIDENNSIQFCLKIKSFDEPIPTKLEVKNYIELFQQDTKGLQRCYMTYATHLENLSRDKIIPPVHLILILRLGLIITDKYSFLVFEGEFLDSMIKCEFPSSAGITLSWLYFTKYLVKVSMKLLIGKKAENGETLVKLFYVALKLACMVDFEDFQQYSLEWDQIKEDLQELFEIVTTNQTLVNLEMIINDLKEMITNVNNEQPVSQVMAIYTTYLSEDNYDSIRIPISHRGITSKGTLFESSFSRIRNPELLTSLTLEAVTISMPHLQSSMNPCYNLVKIYIKACRFHGNSIDKVELPKLNHFEMELLGEENREFALSKIIEYYTFFCGRDSFIWKSIKGLHYYSITNSNRSVRFDNDSQIVTLEGVSINKYSYQLSYFKKVMLKNCKVVIGENETNINYTADNLGKSLPNNYDDLYKTDAFNLRHFELILSDKDAKDLDLTIMDSFFAGRDSCIWIFISRLGYYCIRNSTHSIKFEFDKNTQTLTCHKLPIFNFHYRLNYFHNLKINYCKLLGSNSKMHCSCSFCTEKLERHAPEIVDENFGTYCNSGVGKMKRTYLNSQMSKKLTLYVVTPVDDNGNEVKTIDFSSLNVDELDWNDYDENKYFVMIDRIPTGLKKLCLVNVGLKCGEGPNFTSNHPNMNNNALSLHKLILEGFGLGSPLKLDLGILPYSLKELKLRRVSLTGEILPHNTFHLNKLILVDYNKEDFEKNELKSLLREVDNVIINPRTSMIEYKHIRPTYLQWEMPISYLSLIYGHRRVALNQWWVGLRRS